MTPETLKPCPFCGCKMNQDPKVFWHPRTPTCWFNGKSFPNYMLAAWNTRADREHNEVPEGE